MLLPLGAGRAGLEDPGDMLERKHAEISELHFDSWLQPHR
jgi:hypothetical protein|eukprot:COSAG06_NODE_2180_length_7403_cov_177.368154_3_plen_40_part_00